MEEVFRSWIFFADGFDALGLFFLFGFFCIDLLGMN